MILEACDVMTKLGAYLDHKFDIVGDLIATVQTAVLVGGIADCQQVQEFLLIHADTPSNLSQTGICLVAGFVDHADIEELGLVLKQGRTEFPELFWGQSKNCCPSLVDESRRWVPRLDMLAEDDLEFRAVLLGNHRSERVEGVEQLGRELEAGQWSYMVSVWRG